MDFSSLLIKLFIFMVLMLVGYFMGRKGILDKQFVKNGSTLLVDVFIFASIINSVLGSRPELGRAEFGNAMLLVTLTTIITYALAYLVALPFAKKENAAQIEMMFAISNTLFVGLPVASAIYGSESVFYIGMSCVPYNIVLYSYGVWRLKHDKGDGKIRIKDMLSICLLASIAALVIFLLNPPIPRLISELFSTVSAATVPLSMIIIGASMSAINPAIAFREKRNYLYSLVKLIVCPVITYLILRNFTDNKILLITCTILAGCPTGAIATPLSVQYGYSPEESSKAIMVTTILSMFTLPLMLYIIG